ncbi:glycosyltransferase family 2 protein [Geotalea sp. SG265]|uniref:glycosyltransferase family 2 protein n=1 Tax=Geotalea sp. SG265 TaxID=2922867 RepID=UPI001FAF2185|nr:glycosyltransferase family 2 protein [Geotalea sp. SG265]
MSRVYIIIVNWNGWRDTIECLDSVLLLKYTNYRIVVCDNGSTDESIAMLRQWAERTVGRNDKASQFLSRDSISSDSCRTDPLFTLIDNGGNLGFGAGANVGLRHAMARGDADYCWLLNNDTVVDPMALSAMVERLVAKPDAGICGSTLRYYDDRSHVQALGGAKYFEWLGLAWHLGRTIRGEVSTDPVPVEKQMSYVVGASMLVRACYVKTVGLLAEDYFLYFEELDWVYRGKGSYSLAYAPQSIVYHKVGRSIGTATNPVYKSAACDYYSLRNRIRFSRRYCRSRLPVIYVGILLESAIRVFVGRWDLARSALKVVKEGLGNAAH